MTQSSGKNTERRGLSRGGIFLLGGVALVGILLFAVFYYGILHPPSQRVDSGLAPDFTVTTYDGETFTLSEHFGKPIVINFWASWCETCKDEQPLFEQSWQQHQGEVLFFGLSHLDQDKNARYWLDYYKVSYPNALDVGGKVYNLYHVQGVPETFFIDAQGNLVDYYVGAFPTAGLLEQYVQLAINPPAKQEK
jgi:cytochrome c biogenesis protein CcmG/thiol:disulfide interchange protein DsbE